MLIGMASLSLQFTAQLPSVVAQLENTLKDAMRRSVASAAPEDRIVIIDIDENSIKLIGPWPWYLVGIEAIMLGHYWLIQKWLGNRT
jgi:adenylate cyclase